ncbi:MAG: flavoprotein, partial [Planctomycetota bacterium]
MKQLLKGCDNEPGQAIRRAVRSDSLLKALACIRLVELEMCEKTANSNSSQAGGFGTIRESRPCVLLGVSGGVAAYKAVDLASKLTALGASVKTVMTENACQFVGAKSFEAVTCSAVFSSMWSRPEDHKSTHIA